jgi:outer membrane receptor protein involved in Fe transport
MANLAITDALWVRLNVLDNHRNGYIDNLSGGRDPGQQDNQAARLAARWNLNEQSALQLSYEWGNVDNAPLPAMGFSAYSYSKNPFSDKVENDVIEGKETRRMNAVTGKFFHQFNPQWHMKLISSYRQWNTANKQDEDGTGNATVYADSNNQEDSDILYHEIQFNFNHQHFDWVFGANYSQEDVKQRTTLTLLADSIARIVTHSVNAGLGSDMDHIWNPESFASAINNAGFGNTFCGSEGCSAAIINASGDSIYNALAGALSEPLIFGPSLAGTPWPEYIENTGTFTNFGIYSDLDITLNSQWNLLLGLRYSNDHKDFSWYSPTTQFTLVRPGVSNQIFNNDPALGINIPNDEMITSSDSWHKITGRAIIQYSLSDSASSFLSYSTGYKSGGFDSLNVASANDPFAPEASKNIEWGIKGDFFDQTLRSQFSVYHLQIDDRQRAITQKTPEQIAPSPLIINGDQTLKGLEVTLDWLVFSTLKIGMITTYRDEVSSFEAHYNDNGVLIHDSDKTNTDTAFTATLDWSPKIKTGALLLHLDYIYRENPLKDSDNYDPVYAAIDRYGDPEKRLNGRLAWLSDDDHYELALWAKNITNNQYAIEPWGRTKAFFGTVHTRVNEPRTYGIEARYRF